MPTRSFVARLKLIGAALGAVWIWAVPVSAQVVSEDYKLITSDGVSRDEFGFSVAIDHDLIAVGTNEIDRPVYLFDVESGLQIATLRPDDGERHFGTHVAMEDGIIAVTGGFHGRPGRSVYLFDTETRSQYAKLESIDGGQPDWFGSSVVIDNGLVAVGANRDSVNGTNSGSAYLFDAATGTLIEKITPADGNAEDKFGISVAMEGGVLAIGAVGDDEPVTDAGSVYLYDVDTLTQITKLTRPDGYEVESLGGRVAVDNGKLVTLVTSIDPITYFRSYAVYVFELNTLELVNRLIPEDDAPDGLFGNTLAFQDGVVAVGAPTSDSLGHLAGSAYLFSASTGAQLAKLVPSDIVDEDLLGSSIALDNGRVLVGAYRDDNDNGFNAGSAYVFSVPAVDCTADINGDGMLTPDDFTAWVNAFNNKLPECDQNSDGSCTPTDFTAWIANYNAGC